MHYAKMRLLYIFVIIHLTNLTSGDQPSIVIIGAGAAGIAAASKLWEHGFHNITILEAEDRVGGRVNTSQFGDSWVDLGAQWVHGEENNVVFELAWPLGVLEYPERTPGNYSIYNSNGNRVPSSICDTIIDVYNNLEDEISENLKGNNGSVGEYFTNMMNIELKKHPEINDTLIKSFLKLFNNHQNAEDGADSWFDVSARGYVETWSCPGNYEVQWKGRGYRTLFDILLKKYPNPNNELPILNNTLLNSEVRNVNYRSIPGKAVVETINELKYIVDHVIVTPSLGVLKEQYQTLFTPELPESKVKSIKGLSYGAVAKLYLSFEEPWWDDDIDFISFIWSESDRLEYENDPDKKWLLDLFCVMTLAHRPNIISVWMSGPGVRYMEALPEDQVLNQTLAQLDKFLGKSYNITKPVGFMRSNWYTNKHFRGTYSFRSMETEKVGAWAHDLAAPLLIDGKPIIMFAGEATESHYFSNVHGAVASGFREANRLIDIYNNALD